MSDEERDELYLRLEAALVDTVPRSREYLDRTDDDPAIRIALEKIEEWDYLEDSHGYCHERPTLIRLLQIALR